MAKKKVRVDFQKNRRKPPRRTQVRGLDYSSDEVVDRLHPDERISGRGELTRHRTIVTTVDESTGEAIPVRAVDADCLTGRILTARGTGCRVQDLATGQQYDCSVRRVVRTMSSDDRSAVVAGDDVLFRPSGNDQGVIERINPRRGVLTRKAKGRKHIIAANVDQVLIVSSAADPHLKPSLIDRYLISAGVGGLKPIICINKADLVDLAELQPIIGLYAQLGYEIVPTSNHSGLGLARLRQLLAGKATAFTGQSGVGKSSLINSVEPGLNISTRDVSEESRKGKHTTTVATLHPLSHGGWVLDTPGIRSLELWDVIPDEVEGYFVEFHPFVRDCRFPDCSHRHERACGVKRAVALGYISHIRYESYWKIRSDEFD